MPVRILLADDEPLVRAGLALLLAGEPGIEIIGEAGDGQQAVEMARQLQPDIVLMDVRMPVLDGVAATRLVVVEGGVRVLVLTTYHADEAVYAALRAGASGFLLKDAVPAELVAAIRAVAAGQGWLHPLRLSRYVWSEWIKPAMWGVAALAPVVRATRIQVPADHPLRRRD